MSTFNNIAVIGGVSWATAIVKMLSESQTSIAWWMRNVFERITSPTSNEGRLLHEAGNCDGTNNNNKKAKSAASRVPHNGSS